MFVVSVCSLKGGVGKTSVVLGLAAAARARGLTTLVVDLDPQGDATYALGVDAPGAVSADVLERPKRKVLERAIVPAGWPRGGADLHVLPSSDATANLDRPDADGEQLHTLRTALGKLDYDLVLIDAPPSLSGLTRSALVASDRAVVVTEAGAFAVNAVTRLFAAIDEIRRTEAGGLQPLGIVLNRYKPSMAEQRAQRAALERAFGPLVLSPTLPDRAVVPKAQGARAPLDAMSGGAAALQGFELLLGRIERASRLTRRGGRRASASA